MHMCTIDTVSIYMCTWSPSAVSHQCQWPMYGTEPALCIRGFRRALVVLKRIKLTGISF